MSSPTHALPGVALCLASLLACTPPAPEPAPAPVPVAPPSGFPGGALSTHTLVELPFLVSGADVVTLWANGGPETRAGTQLGDRDLGFKLVAGDTFTEQVARYQAGETPFLRASWSAVGMAYDQLCPSEDAPTCPVLVLGLGSSRDDTLLVRGDANTVADLKGKLVSLQRGGPHAEALFSLLRDAGVAWSDVHVFWKERRFGPGSAAEAMSVDTNLAGAWVLGRDVAPLLKPIVSQGEELAAARALVRTADHPDLVVECLFVRQDYLTEHATEIERLRAGWLHAVEQVRALRAGSPESEAFLTAVAGVYGPDAVPDARAAQALLDGVALYGLPENIVLSGDSPDQVDHVDLSKRSSAFAEAMGRPAWTWTMGVAATHWGGADFADLPHEASAAGVRVVLPLAADATTVDLGAHAADLDPVWAALKVDGNVLRVRGHVDPQRVLQAALQAGLDAGRVVRGGTESAPTYTLDGKVLEVTDGKELLAALPAPPELLREARLVATARAQAVRDGLLAYASERGITLDAARVQVEGVGADEPVVGLTTDPKASAENRRVELIVVPATQGTAPTGGW